MVKALSCPKCGAPLNLQSEDTRTVKCEYCDTIIQLDTQQNVSRIGKYVPKKDTGPLKLGMQGNFRGRNFQVVGLLEYSNVDGDVWWEYLVVFDDGESAWISYDDGDWSILFKKKLRSPLPENPRPGQVVTINNMSVFIEEVGVAKITNVAGEIPFAVDADEEINYIDGYNTEDDSLVSIEYTEDEIEMFIGYETSKRGLGL